MKPRLQTTVKLKIENDPVDVLKKCRTCLVEESELVKIFHENKIINPSLADKIVACTQVYVGENDGFPQYICNNCVELLESAYNFREICQKSEKFLSAEADKHYKGFELLREDVNDKPIDSTVPTAEYEQVIYLSDDNDIKDGHDSDFSGQVENESSDDNNTAQDSAISNLVSEDSKSVMKSKRKTRPKQKNKQCDECGYVTTAPCLLENHKRYHHEGVRDFKCKLCPKMYGTKGNLVSHVRNVHETRDPVTCDICGKSVKNSFLLKAHRHYHFAEKRFACSYCPFKATRKLSIQRHETQHTGVRNFPCTLCEKMFSTNQRLQHHVRGIHYNIRPAKV